MLPLVALAPSVAASEPLAFERDVRLTSPACRQPSKRSGPASMTERNTPTTLLHFFVLDHRELVFEHGGQKHVITAGRESHVVLGILR